MKSFFTLLLFFTTNLFSLPLEVSSNEEPSLYEKLLSLDYIQSNISNKIVVFSSNLDQKARGWVKNDANSSVQELAYLQATNKSYIRLRMGTEANKEEGFAFLNNIRVNLRLPKTEKELYLFIGDDEDEDEDGNAKSVNMNYSETPTSVGLKYFIKSMDAFKANLFAGLRGVTNPVIKLRLQYPIAFKYVSFRPVQYVEYSLEDEFKEETQFYFDHCLAGKKELIRLSLSRYTQTYLKGMNYSAQLSYLGVIEHEVGFQLYSNLSGRTKLNSAEPVNAKYNVIPTTGVYNYSSGIIWKQRFFKKYLFYELQPLVEFNQQYAYNANYVFRANIEMYFGNI